MKEHENRYTVAQVNEQETFWGWEGFLTEFPQTCPKSFCATLAYKFSPTNIMKTVFSVTSKKRSSCVFLHTLGAVFSNQTLGTRFCPDFQGFIPDIQDFSQFFRDLAQIFKDFAQMFRDFVRFLDKSKLLWVRLHPCTPPSTPLRGNSRKAYAWWH